MLLKSSILRLHSIGTRQSGWNWKNNGRMKILRGQLDNKILKKFYVFYSMLNVTLITGMTTSITVLSKARWTMLLKKLALKFSRSIIPLFLSINVSMSLFLFYLLLEKFFPYQCKSLRVNGQVKCLEISLSIYMNFTSMKIHKLSHVILYIFTQIDRKIDSIRIKTYAYVRTCLLHLYVYIYVCVRIYFPWLIIRH